MLALFTGTGGEGGGGAKYQISGAEKCQNPFGGNLDTGASPYQPYQSWNRTFAKFEVIK